MKEFTSGEMTATIAEQYDWYARTVFVQVNGWLERGDGIAVYRNNDLSSPDAGEYRLASYGSQAAQLETGTPPDTLPDGLPAGAINWRYKLDGTYRGDVLMIPVDLPEAPEDYPVITSEDHYWDDDRDEVYPDDEYYEDDYGE